MKNENFIRMRTFVDMLLLSRFATTYPTYNSRTLLVRSHVYASVRAYAWGTQKKLNVWEWGPSWTGRQQKFLLSYTSLACFADNHQDVMSRVHTKYIAEKIKSCRNWWLGKQTESNSNYLIHKYINNLFT